MNRHTNLHPLPAGKIPPSLLAELTAGIPIKDPLILLGPGVGMDCAVIDYGPEYLVLKSDPITFTEDQIGWYAVHVNSNDIASSGASPKWMLVTALLPERKTTTSLVKNIFDQITQACQEINVTLIGGHTEITVGLDRPILVGTMIGTVSKDHLVTPKGARAGDRVLITKGVPIEATAILAREFEADLSAFMEPEEITHAKNYLKSPGISILPESRIALMAGQVTAMHDATEGGLYSALWELAIASNKHIWFEPDCVPISEISKNICEFFKIDPLGAISSGALLLTCPGEDSTKIIETLEANRIQSADIGFIMSDQKVNSHSEPGVWKGQPGNLKMIPFPVKDEILKVFFSTARI